ncbi:hypothetical protein F3Y22_tig00110933pilonHSYRG00168 [Hibiscus syriacus]|uniref:Uncharacterized protein n=1 Tax=Hibiscus syriacus TaxID=106335 RepID=A0A6A2ZCE3_HIBSY|nr:hypothetical protein F3Y22_tig00110933pilonHSYRG00168 [Hibiscus syriacus]
MKTGFERQYYINITAAITFSIALWTSPEFAVVFDIASSNGFPRENIVHMNPSKHRLPLKVELLDPTSLGICTEPTDWLERDEILLLPIEQKANNVRIPHSSRFIKRKRSSKLNSLVDHASEFAYSSVRNAISSLVFIIREIQSFSLMIKEGLSSEDLTAAMSKIQQDDVGICLLFQHVFSKTPTLMVYVVLLLANFSVQSMADKAPFEAIQGPVNVITEIKTQTVPLEPDNYDVHFRTDLVYQMCVAEEPDNALLLANYARFLHLVVKDYDRAEEFYKRAIEADPEDSEALGLFADFLWQVRNDHWEAEEIYSQALQVDEKNPFHASKYANFLWNTGGEGTCLVFDAPE